MKYDPNYQSKPVVIRPHVLHRVGRTALARIFLETAHDLSWDEERVEALGEWIRNLPDELFDSFFATIGPKPTEEDAPKKTAKKSSGQKTKAKPATHSPRPKKKAKPKKSAKDFGHGPIVSAKPYEKPPKNALRKLPKKDKATPAIAKKPKPLQDVLSAAHNSGELAFQWLLRRPNGAAVGELRAANGLSEGAAKGLLKRWKDAGRVRLEGTKRNARYYAIAPGNGKLDAFLAPPAPAKGEIAETKKNGGTPPPDPRQLDAFPDDDAGDDELDDDDTGEEFGREVQP